MANELMLLCAGASGVGVDLLSGLVAFWKLGEATGAQRDDSVGSSHLTDHNSAVQAAGKVGNAASFDGVNQYLSRATNAALEMGDVDFTIAVWAKRSAGVAAHGIIRKSGASKEYSLWSPAGARTPEAIKFEVSADGSASDSVNSTAPLDTNWHLYICWHDAAANLIWMQSDDAAPVSASHSGGAFVAASDFEIGRTPAGDHFNGLVDAVGIWERVLTAAERAALWNNGAGLEHPFS